VPQIPNRPRSKIPLFGGTLTIAIIETRGPPQTGPGPARTSRQRTIARLQQKSKLGTARPSDDVEGLRFNVHWEPARGALGINIALNDPTFPAGVVQVVRVQLRRGFANIDATNLDPGP
jgi:mediator of RNA polymerase II transcription subunit 14